MAGVKPIELIEGDHMCGALKLRGTLTTITGPSSRPLTNLKPILLISS